MSWRTAGSPGRGPLRASSTMKTSSGRTWGCKGAADSGAGLPQERIRGVAHPDRCHFPFAAANIENRQPPLLSHKDFTLIQPAHERGMTNQSCRAGLDPRLHDLDSGKLGNCLAGARPPFGVFLALGRKANLAVTQARG